MEQSEREELNKEWLKIQERMKGEFVNPKDMRRSDEITSLLLTNGESGEVRFKFLKKGSRAGTKGLNLKKTNGTR